jgi:hypothetical protein
LEKPLTKTFGTNDIFRRFIIAIGQMLQIRDVVPLPLSKTRGGRLESFCLAVKNWMENIARIEL